MSCVYEKTMRLCMNLTETQVKGRLMCERGQLAAGKIKGNLLKATKDRVRALEDSLEYEVVKQVTIESKVELTYRVAKKYQHLHDRAVTRGKDFDLDLSDVRRLLTKKRCAYTGVILTDKEQHLPTKDSYRTIDRLDPLKGYVKGNVYAVSNAANATKNILFESSTKEVSIGVSETTKMCEFLKGQGFTPR